MSDDQKLEKVARDMHEDMRRAWAHAYGLPCWALGHREPADDDDESGHDDDGKIAAIEPVPDPLPTYDWKVVRDNDGKYVLHGPKMRRVFIGADRDEAEAACAGLNRDVQKIRDLAAFGAAR